MDIKKTNLWTAVITPMSADGSIDYPSLKKTLKAQDQAGNGILILGSTGEALNIDESEAREVLTFVTGINRSVPLMCGVGGINLSSTTSWVQYLNTLDIDCYLLVTPLYAKPGPEGQYLWFKTLLDEAKKPCMLYNVPSRTGVSMSLAAIGKLNQHENFWAIKEASGDTAKFAQYVAAAGAGKVFSGDDAMLPEFCKIGAAGLISVASNVWPKETNLYVEKCLSKELKEINLWVEATNSLFVASNPIPVKWLMKEVGQIESATLRAPLCLEDMKDENTVVDANTSILNWYEQNKG